MTTKTDIEQERAEFEAWANGRCELHLVNPAGRYSSATTQFAWESYQAGRAALQSQDREDAERYKELRTGQMFSVLNWIGDELRGEALDEAVDRARISRRLGRARRAEGEGNDTLPSL